MALAMMMGLADVVLAVINGVTDLTYAELAVVAGASKVALDVVDFVADAALAVVAGVSSATILLWWVEYEMWIGLWLLLRQKLNMWYCGIDLSFKWRTLFYSFVL